MMIDVATIRSLELIQNSRDVRSVDCLFGLLNQTQTPMGPRLLRSNMLQPLTDEDVLNRRYDAVEELASKEEMFFSIRAGSCTCYRMLFYDTDFTQPRKTFPMLTSCLLMFVCCWLPSNRIG